MRLHADSCWEYVTTESEKKSREKNGGGHNLACGARLSSFEDVDLLVKDLDYVCKKYIESSDIDENY